MPEIIIILVLAVLLFGGASKLPELGAGMGKAIREFRKATADVRESVATTATAQPASPVAPSPPASTSATPEQTSETPTSTS